MTDNPLVSIIVRTKDRPELLDRAIQSIAAQTYRPIEVVLVNDGGCDLDVEELKSDLGDVCLNYIRLEKNTGRAHAGNVGIENAKGQYIGFLDDDDDFYPEHVETLVAYLKQSDLKIAYTDSMMVYKEYDSETQELRELRNEFVYSADFDFNTFIFENHIPFMCLMFQREVLIGSGGFDSRFELYEDHDLLIRIGELYSFHHIQKITANYNQWSVESQISQRNKDTKFLKRAYIQLFSKHLDKFTPDRIYHFKSIVYDDIGEKDLHIKKMDIHMKEMNIHIGELKTYAKNLHDVLKGKDEYVSNLIYQINQRDQQIVELESLVRNKDLTLHGIYSSHGWKVLLFYYKIRDRILPAHSIRRHFVKRIFDFTVSFAEYFLKKKHLHCPSKES